MTEQTNNQTPNDETVAALEESRAARGTARFASGPELLEHLEQKKGPQPCHHSDDDEDDEEDDFDRPRKTKTKTKSASSVNDRQVGGTHYRQSYQHWDYATDLQMRHLEGAITKYLSRFGNKVGEPATKDLEKVSHYLDKLIDVATPPSRTRVVKSKTMTPLAEIQKANRVNAAPIVARFLSELGGNAFQQLAVSAFIVLSSWTCVEDLHAARGYVSLLLQKEQERETIAATKGMD